MKKEKTKKPAKLGSVKKTTKKEPKFRVTIDVNEETTKLQGDNVLEILKQFNLPDFVKTNLTVVLASDGKEASMILNVSKTRRVFSDVGAGLELLASDLSKRLH